MADSIANAVPTLRQRLRDTAAEAMLVSAEETMVRLGYEKATMQEIAAAAGCAAGTFYLYFKNKEELLQAIIGRRMHETFGGASRAMEGQSDPLEKLKAAFRAFLAYFNRNRPFYRLFFTALPGRHRVILQQLAGTSTVRLHDDYAALELGVLRERQARGEVRSDFPAESLQEFMMAVTMSLVEQFAFAERKIGVEEQWRQIWGFVSAGIGAVDARPKGANAARKGGLGSRSPRSKQS